MRSGQGFENTINIVQTQLILSAELQL